MVIVAGMGVQGSTGFDIAVAAAQSIDHTLRVRVDLRAPGGDCSVGGMITNPVDVTRLPTSHLLVTFEDRYEESRCTESRGSEVPAVPPDTVPYTIFDDSNAVEDTSFPSAPVLRNIVLVRFGPAATQAERQRAIESVGGRVIGGRRFTRSDGIYFVRIAHDGTAGPLARALVVLRSLPQVASALPQYLDLFRPN